MKDLKRLIPYLAKYKKKIAIGFVVVTISNFCSTYVPKLVGETIDLISKNGFFISDVYENIGLILLFTFLSGLFMYYTRRTIIVASREIEYDLRRDLMNAIRDQSMNFFHSHPTGMLMAHSTNDIPATREFLGPAVMYSANTLTTFVFALYFMLSLSPSITLIGLIPLPFIAYLTYLLGKKIHIAFKNVQEKYADLTTQAQDTFSGLRVMRAYSREANELKLFETFSFDYLKKNLKLAKYDAFFIPVLTLLVGSSQILVLYFGGNQVIEGTATLGDLTQFFIYLELLIWPVAAIGWVTNLVQRGAASTGRLGVLMDNKPDIIENNNKSLKINNYSIKFEDVSYSYTTSKNDVLQNINLNIPEGSSLGIVGKIGSGKTTFINLISRLYDVESGTIKIGDINLKDISFKSLRDSIGVVSQEPFLFSDTILNNIRFGNEDASLDQIIEIAKKVKLSDEVLTFEKQYNTMLGERGITLSGGQKQRLAIARALIMNPKILILDDSLSAVDTNTEEYILNSLKEFYKERTTILISHRLSVVKNVDNIIFLENGRIIEQGSHTDLINLNGKYAHMYKLQQIAAELEKI
ncbi:MAG TPA: ABC transporter ATP-binding protein [Candidatus Kapabacteria bacterium]|nr:ABC transporter ATP-binding protein [Candidatus Kapabacteria bacterium]